LSRNTNLKSNSRHHITVLNADVPNCYTMLKVFSRDGNRTKPEPNEPN